MATPKIRHLFTKMRPFALEQAYIIFSVIYFPVTFLFQYRGRLSTSLLILYTLAMILGAAVLIAKFALYLAHAANQHNGRYGSIFVSYLLDAFIPMVMFKFLFITLWNSLASFPVLSGCWCDFINFVKSIFGLYDLFGRQLILNNLILGSLIAVGLFTLWSVAQKSR